MGDQLRLDIAFDPNPTRPRYIGTIHFGGRQFPFAATRGGGDRIVGKFRSGADSFDCSATLAGSTLVFQTGGTTYRMARVALAHPAEPVPPTSREAPTSRPVATSRPTAVATAPASRPAAARLELKPVAIYDAMMDCQAASLRVPDGWKCRLDVVWRQNPYDPAVIAGAVSEPNGPARLSIYPRLSFIDGVPAPDASNGWYMGSEVRKPVASPADYVRQIILPRFRTDIINPRVVLAIELQDFAHDQLSKFQNVPGVRVKASRVRVVYVENGNRTEEEFVCTVGAVPMPRGMVAWGTECTSYRAARGELDAKLPLLRGIESSLHVDLPWYSAVLQVSQRMQQDLPGSATDVARLSRYISQRSPDVSALARQSYERRERVLARCNADLDAAIGATLR